MDKTEGTGQRIGGYRVVRKLATGATSDVLLAKAEGPHGFERTVVLKLLLPQYTHDADVLGMFAREAAAYARLNHPSIVRLYDFFANDEQLVMVLEYIDGPPLGQLRGMLKAIGHQLDDPTAIHIAASLFSALAAAHAAVDESGDSAPVIHRDVNPSNVLIPWDGSVRLADFGVAKVTGASHQSSAGLIRGTFGYMAPEQVKGEMVTPRADVYAGAIILWELLSKRRAFIRGALPEIEVLRELSAPRIVSIDVLRPDLGKSVRDAITRALEPRGDKRTITAEEVASVLRSAVPESAGREQLAKTLALVRHEPKPPLTSIPPPVTMTFGGPDPARYQASSGAASKPAFAPRVTPPPRPTVKGVAARAPGAGSPRPAAVAPSRLAAAPHHAAAEDAAPSSERGLAALLEPSERDPRPRDSIDDVLRAVPSNVPPNLFPKTDPPGGIPRGPVGSVPAIGEADTMSDLFARGIGDLPPAPLPLDPSVPLDLGATFSDEPDRDARPISSFPPLDRTLAIERGPVGPPVRPLPSLGETAPLPRVEVAATGPDTARMGGFAGSPVVHAAPAMVHAAAGRGPPTLPLATAPVVTPALSAGLQLSPAAPGSYPPPHASAAAPSASGAYPPLASPSSPPTSPRRRSSVGAVVGLVVVLSLVMVAGVVGYTRWPRAHVATPTTSATPTPTSATSPPTAAAASSAVASAALSAAASPLPPMVAPPPSAASALPPASATSAVSAADPVADLPPGTGRVRTAGAAPGRRIFVDERTVGQTPDSVVVKCGPRNIKLGSAGVARPVDVPCGAEITVGDR